jgi:hypothetical protein
VRDLTAGELASNNVVETVSGGRTGWASFAGWDSARYAGALASCPGACRSAGGACPSTIGLWSQLPTVLITETHYLAEGVTESFGEYAAGQAELIGYPASLARKA